MIIMFNSTDRIMIVSPFIASKYATWRHYYDEHEERFDESHFTREEYKEVGAEFIRILNGEPTLNGTFIPLDRQIWLPVETISFLRSEFSHEYVGRVVLKALIQNEEYDYEVPDEDD